MVAVSHLRSFQALELALRLGSLKAAADVLAITPAAVGQRIKTLEDYLGIDLVVRGRSGLSATPELAVAMDDLRAAFASLDSAAHALQLQRVHELHITAAPDFATLWLEPRLTGFHAAHPNIRFRINGAGDAPARGGPPDCEIAFGPVDARADLLFRDYLLPLCTPGNSARILKLDPAVRLEGFPLLHHDAYAHDAAAIGWPQWIAAHGFRRTGAERGIRFQRLALALDAALSNAGLVIGGIALASRMLDDGRLTLPFPVATGAWTSHAHQARFRADALRRPQVMAFRHWLLRESRVTEAWQSATIGAVAPA